MAAGGVLSAGAQAPKKSYTPDSLLSRWVIDLNLKGGLSNQDFTTANTTLNYPEAVNANTGNLKYKNGYAFGGDVQLGFFFGKKRHWGLGAGFMYLAQDADAILDNYHVEYKATDFQGSTFRQVISGNDVREHLSITNLNIPVTLKYKNRFSKHWGFAAEGGALFNVQMKNAYTTHAAFDYEAIYKFGGADGGNGAVYDNSPTPAAGDWLITRAEFQRNNPNGNMQDYFNTKRALGYSVGLGEPVQKAKGDVSYTTGSVGFLFKPSFNYFFSDRVALDLGLYYLFQPFQNTAASNYHLTDGAGNYTSVIKNVTAANNQSYGINLGLRCFLGNRKDRDHDGIVDRKDKCPDVFGLAKFNGCPDTDNDGIPDSEDSCVTVPGLAIFHGCPDTDGDGIPDKNDSCPLQAGSMANHGCPDRDGDGIIDKEDRCPDVFGLVAFKGCPDTDGDGIPDIDDKCPKVAGPISNDGCPLDTTKVVTPPPTEKMDETGSKDLSTPILFDIDKSEVHSTANSVLDEAARDMKQDRRAKLRVDGHADITGPEAHNVGLSDRRAEAVKAELVKRGVKASRITTVGHGSSEPEESNKTSEGRHENRRAVISITPGKK